MTLIYADTSAVAKLFVTEKESAALRDWLAGQRGASLISSELLHVELRRLLAMVQPDAMSDADRFLDAKVDLVEVTRPVLTLAERMPPPRMRTLAAIHLATAFDLGETLDVLVSYDKAVLDSARNAGLGTASPSA